MRISRDSVFVAVFLSLMGPSAARAQAQLHDLAFFWASSDPSAVVVDDARGADGKEKPHPNLAAKDRWVFGNGAKKPSLDGAAAIGIPNDFNTHVLHIRLFNATKSKWEGRAATFTLKDQYGKLIVEASVPSIKDGKNYARLSVIRKNPDYSCADAANDERVNYICLRAPVMRTQSGGFTNESVSWEFSGQSNSFSKSDVEAVASLTFNPLPW